MERSSDQSNEASSLWGVASESDDELLLSALQTTIGESTGAVSSSLSATTSSTSHQGQLLMEEMPGFMTASGAPLLQKSASSIGFLMYHQISNEIDNEGKTVLLLVDATGDKHDGAAVVNNVSALSEGDGGEFSASQQIQLLKALQASEDATGSKK